MDYDFLVGVDRREQIRHDIEILAPTLRMLFHYDLPDPRCNFALPSDDDAIVNDVDKASRRYHEALLNHMFVSQDVIVLPLNTTGDGNCMVGDPPLLLCDI